MKKDNDPRKPDRRRIRSCYTMEDHRELAAISPEYRRLRRQIEAETQDWLNRNQAEGLRTGVVRIPVVVHVVWNTGVQNVSQTQIDSQIRVLNEDFRRTNPDAGSVPSHFASLAADTRIEFALAVRDPNCGVTTGITRTNTATTGFTRATRQSIKSAATGGADPWPSDRYMNMWVANFTDGLLGFGSFPGGPAALDGIVIDTQAFGFGGVAVAPFHRGRTATHEVGHWLNLNHIWGDDQALPNNCSQSDNCADTPNQSVATTGNPSGIRTSCSNGPNGDMYMNYMDYTDDVGMFMMTPDQAARMHATLSVARTGILSSDGLVPATAGLPATDLWMQDNADDTGAEPTPGSLPLWISDDIWIRNGSDGLTNQDHQNPRSAEPNNAYVRVRNRGCPGGGSQSGTVRLYWAKASPSLSWPAPWDGSVTAPALMGAAIGNQSVTLAAGASTILTFPWTPPDPSDYAAFGADKAHFCLLARIETSAAVPFGMTVTETGNLSENVRTNNNIVWKNISIIDTDGDGARSASVVIGGFGKQTDETHLVFLVPEGKGPNLFDWGHVLAEFRGEALVKWADGEIETEGVQRLEDGRLFITRPGARIRGGGPKPGAFGTLHLQFVPGGRAPVGAQVFALDLMQVDREGRPVGGQRFLLRTALPGCRPHKVECGMFDGVDWPKGAGCGCGWG